MDKIARRSIWAKGAANHFKMIDVLVIASCYKLVSISRRKDTTIILYPFNSFGQNTIESYSYAEYLWIEVSEFGYLKKTASFMAAFAFKQRKWGQLMRITNKNPGNPIIEQIKLLTWLELACDDELIECISSWVTDERFSNVKISNNVVC